MRMLGQDGRHLEGVHEVGLARGPRLALVLDRGEDVGLAQHLEVGPRMVPPDGLVDVFEADHEALNALQSSECQFREASTAGRQQCRPFLDLTLRRGTIIFVFEVAGSPFAINRFRGDGS